jgi:chromosome segregation ATPase
MLTGQSNQAHRSGKVSGSSSASTAVTAQARLGNVIKTLQGIKDSFQKDLEVSKRSDLKEFQAYMKRHQAQQEQKEALEASLGKLEKEYAARNQAKVESEEEVSTLKDQIATDKTIRADTSAALEERKTEWDERLLCSQGELQALGQAIETLTTDDARDLFRKAKSFVQVSSDVTLASAARAAGQVLRSAGKAAKDHRLLILAAKLSGMRQAGANITNPTFDHVYKSMDDMVDAIKSEDQSDLTKKESCEEALANNTAEKKRLEREIENEESAMSSAQGKISEMSDRLEKIATQQAEVAAQVKSADELRDAEAAAFNQSKKDDQNAIQLIEQATAFITKFYSDDAAPSLLQTKSSTCSAGAQSSGIVQTMKMVADDVRKEILEAEKDENEASAAYKKNMAAFEAEKNEIDTARSHFQTVRSTKSLDLTSANDSKATITGQLDSLVGTMAEVKPNCDFYINNFESRSKNRQSELEGLKQAKVILQSA